MLEGLILLGVGLWTVAAIRYARKHKGGCGGNCASCQNKNCPSPKE